MAPVEITAMPNKVLASTHKKGLEGAFLWRHVTSGLYLLVAGRGKTRAAAWRDALSRHNSARAERFAIEAIARKASRKRRGW